MFLQGGRCAEGVGGGVSCGWCGEGARQRASLPDLTRLLSCGREKPFRKTGIYRDDVNVSDNRAAVIDFPLVKHVIGGSAFIAWLCHLPFCVTTLCEYLTNHLGLEIRVAHNLRTYSRSNDSGAFRHQRVCHTPLFDRSGSP